MKRKRNYVKLRMLEVEIEGDGPKVRKAIDAIATLVTLGRSRESGDSVPAGGRFDARDLAAIASAGGYDPPVLNKSGGSNVEAKMRTYHCVGYYSDAPCATCGAAAGEDCR